MASFVFGEKRPGAVKREPKTPFASTFARHGLGRRDQPRAGGPQREPLAAMGALFGRDFSDVHIHDGTEGDQVARAAGAQALTVGQDIYFRQGAFAPATADGRRVLGHELAHVVQQSGAPAPSGAPVALGARGTSHEREAGRAGEAIAAWSIPRVDLRASMPVAQRFESGEHDILGNRTDESIGTGVSSSPGIAPESDTEKERVAEEKDPSKGGGRFDTGARTLTLTLRQRNPGDDTPSTTTVDVAVSYGEMVALSGDLYYSVDNLKHAPADEVIKLRDSVAAQVADPTSKDFDMEFEKATQWRRKGVYKPGTGVEEGTLGQYWGLQPNDKDLQSSYLDLATNNAAHFSARTGTGVAAGGPEGNAAADNHQAWFTDHNRAIDIAKRVRSIKQSLGQLSTDPGEGGRAVGHEATPDSGVNTGANKGVETQNGVPTAPAPNPRAPAGAAASYAALENDAYLYNAGGDHYLTDAFSSGHLINKDAINAVTDSVMNPARIEKLVDELTPLAGKEHPLIPNFLIKPKIRDGLAQFKTNDFLRHNAGAKLIHDWLNVHGAHVVSINGRFSWLTKGDANLDTATRDVASRAVLASRNYIRALMNDSDAALANPADADDAWTYTPNVDRTKFSAMAAPWLINELTDTPHLWTLMKSVLAAQELMDTQKKSEAKVSSAAKDTKGGDWGTQPTNTRFTRRFVLARVK